MQAQFGTKAQLLQDAARITRKWPFWTENGVNVTFCPSCGDEITFSGRDGYRIVRSEPALTVEPDILCPKPGCDGAVHVYMREVVLLKKPKVDLKPEPVAVGAPTDEERKSLADKVREKLARVRQVS